MGHDQATQKRLAGRREIDQRARRNQETVMRICHRWMQEETTDRRGRSHPHRCTTICNDRRIIPMPVMDSAATSRTKAQQIHTHHSVSARTIDVVYSRVECLQAIASLTVDWKP
ncbi:transposable element Tcb1 transposase [Trichonephila clavipes]|nr:transposable element Tcb1 transposase [Trichonephila clavipes]